MKVLYVGYKAGDIEPGMLEEGAVFHTLDIYHRHAIEKVFHGEAKAVCSAHLPEGPWDKVKFKTGPKLMSGELSLDLLQECYRTGAKVELDFVGKERDRNDLIDKVKDRIDRKFAAKWPASVPGGEKLMFTSYPGCFCHRRLDEGGLALAEVVARDLQSTNPSNLATNQPFNHSTLQPSTFNLLDMGCGCGLVGFLIKSVVSGVNLTMIDSHSRAIEAVEENSRAFGMPVESILSDNGSPVRMDGSFDIFVGNPPYYSDYRIADVFLATAKRALKSGGVAYTVCKNAAGLEPVQARYFPKVEVIHRRGYAILKSASGAGPT